MEHQTLTVDIFVKMKNQIKKAKKAQKARARHKDFTKKKKILANRPTILHTYKKPVFKQEKDRKGVIKMVQIGEKEVRYTVKVNVKTMGIKFPKSRKYKVSKKLNVKTKSKN